MGEPPGIIPVPLLSVEVLGILLLLVGHLAVLRLAALAVLHPTFRAGILLLWEGREHDTKPPGMRSD